MLLDLAWTAGARSRIEECFAQARNDAGLDHYQACIFRAPYTHITLSMLALGLADRHPRTRRKRGTAPSDEPTHLRDSFPFTV